MKNVSSSNSQGELVPKLRFPGFEREWQQRTFSDLFSFLGNNTLSRADLSDSGEVKNIHYGDVLIKFDDTIEANDPRIPYITSPESLKKNIDLLQTGDVIIADTAEDDTVGKATELLNPANIPVVSGLHTIPVRPNDEFYPSYLGYYINSKSYHSQLYPLMQGIKVTSISKGNIGKTLVRYPSHAEQQKIASVLNLLTQRIAKQRQLIDTLKSYKRGLIRTLLSPDRNKRAGVEWTSALIGDLGKFIKGAPLSKADISSKGNPFILYGELYTTYGEVITNVVRKTEAKVDSVYYSKVGDVIVPTSGETPEEISTASCVMAPDVILAGDLNIFRTTKVDGRILSYILNHIVNWQIARIAQGKSVVHIQSSELAQIEIVIPDNDEQKRIVAAVDGVDKIVTNSENTLERLVAVKNALLQQLFI